MKKINYILDEEVKTLRKVILNTDFRQKETDFTHYTEWKKEISEKQINKLLENGYYGQKVFTQSELEKEYLLRGFTFNATLCEINNIYY